MQLRPGIPVFTRPDGEVQFGINSRLNFTGLTEKERDILLDLRTERSPAGFAARAKRLGIDAERLESLRSRLHNAGLLRIDEVPSPSEEGARLQRDVGTDRALGARSAFAVQLYLQPSQSRRETVALRGFLEGLRYDLRAAGIGQVGLEIPGFPLSALGELAGSSNAPTETERERGAAKWDRVYAPDFVIAFFAHAASACNWKPPVVPHLLVVFQSEGVEVGPLVEPDRGPCLKCIDAYCTSVDSAWPQLLLQISAQPFPSPGAQLEAITRIVVTRACTDAIDGGGLAPGQVRFLRRDLLWEVFAWPANPDCECAQTLVS